MRKPTTSFALSTRTGTNVPPRPLPSGSYLAQSVGPSAGPHAFKQPVETRRRPPTAQPKHAAVMEKYSADDLGGSLPTSGKQQNGTVMIPSPYTTRMRMWRLRGKVPTHCRLSLSTTSYSLRRNSVENLTDNFLGVSISSRTAGAQNDMVWGQAMSGLEIYHLHAAQRASAPKLVLSSDSEALLGPERNGQHNYECDCWACLCRTT